MFTSQKSLLAAPRGCAALNTAGSAVVYDYTVDRFGLGPKCSTGRLGPNRPVDIAILKSPSASRPQYSHPVVTQSTGPLPFIVHK